MEKKEKSPITGLYREEERALDFSKALSPANYFFLRNNLLITLNITNIHTITSPNNTIPIAPVTLITATLIAVKIPAVSNKINNNIIVMSSLFLLIVILCIIDCVIVADEKKSRFKTPLLLFCDF